MWSQILGGFLQLVASAENCVLVTSQGYGAESDRLLYLGLHLLRNTSSSRDEAERQRGRESS